MRKALFVILLITLLVTSTVPALASRTPINHDPWGGGGAGGGVVYINGIPYYRLTVPTSTYSTGREMTHNCFARRLANRGYSLYGKPISINGQVRQPMVKIAK